jgi:hypothetical protein
MPDSQVLWTALPRAADAQHVDLDVFVSPRLATDALRDRYELSEFPDWEHWTKTLETTLSFSVELADGTNHPAQVIALAPLAHDAWDSLFPPGSLVRPWSFKDRDLSKRPIYSFPLRFITAYLRDRYREIGQAHPTRPPGPGGLATIVGHLGPITDTRVPAERRPPPRDPDDLPPPKPHPQPPPADGEGCLGLLWRFLRWLVNLVRVLFGLPPLPKPKTPPADPTKPKNPVPRVVHPSPYGAPAPLDPVVPPAREELERQMETNKVATPQLQQYGAMSEAQKQRDTTFDFTRVLRFYERPESQYPKTGHGLDPAIIRPRPEVPELDFHQAVGALCDYPTLLRRLGLVVRLRIPRPAADPGSIRVLPAWNGQPRSTDIAPRTLCTLNGARFVVAAAAGSDIVGGLLDLRQAGDALASDMPKFDVIQVDADGAALKAILVAATLERRRQLGLANVYGYELPDEETLPALRSGGLAVVRPDRAYWVHTHLGEIANQAVPVAGAAGQPQTLAAEFHADDLVRGYRVEVSDDGGATWRSLCWRVGNYRILRADGSEPWSLENFEDEGYVKGSSVTSEPGHAQPLYLHEALVRWTGWSLTVPRPGQTIGRTQEVEAPSAKAATDFRLEARFTAKPGMLPRLRFGTNYQLRILCVDLAGEPLAKAETSSPASDDVMFRRFEPAEAPALLPLRRYLPGESLERVVLRSDFATGAHAYETAVLGHTAADARAQRTRHLFPPKTSQLQAELHGRFDDAFGPTGDPTTGYQLALREAGTFGKPAIDFGSPLEIPFDAAPALGEAEGKGAYVVNLSDETLPTPYLPDPIVAGVALRGVPGLTTHIDGDPLPVHQVPDATLAAGSEPLLQIPFDDPWPDVPSFRLRVDERTAAHVAPRWNAAERLLTIYLAKGRRADIRYSSYLAFADLHAHGVWQWLDEPPSPTLQTQAEVGAHWMLSPPRTLVAVHAVQRPAEPAHFPSLDASGKKLGETSAPLKGSLHAHIASTGRIDVIGTWDEWRDELLDSTPPGAQPTERRKATAFDLTVDEDLLDDSAFPPAGQEQRARHEFGDTKHRTVDYRVRATTRFREYFPDNVISSADDAVWRDSHTADIARVNVLSSARPDVPKVLYIVPTFKWEDTPLPGWTTITQTQSGGGLRVYLERPWYSSGEGELLGVLLAATEPTPPPDELRSRYGADAAWTRNSVHTIDPLMPIHFPNRATDESGVQLAERSGVTASVVGFEPHYDRDRELWFADIEVAVDDLAWNYWPFVRLALVRYQPDSLDEVKVSPVVLSEFAQLAPNRELSLVWHTDQKLTATLRGRGPHHRREPRAAFLVEAAPPAAGPVPDELDWEWVAGSPEIVDESAFSSLVAPDPGGADGELEWTADIDLPSPRGSRPMRLAVREYDLIDVDIEGESGHGVFIARGEVGQPGIPRLTYAAAMPLD